MKKNLFSLLALINLSVFAQIGQTTTYSGTGTSGTTNGTLSQASYNYPQVMVKDNLNNIYVGEWGNFRKIDESGNVTSISNTLGNIRDMAYDPSTNTIIITHVLSSANSRMSRIDLNGNVLNTYYTTGSASPDSIYGVTVDSSGAIYYTQPSYNTVSKFVPSTNTTTNFGVAATFNFPNDLNIDSSNNVYVVDQNNKLIRKISPVGGVISLTGTENNPVNVTAANSNEIYITELNRILKYTVSTNTLTVVSGSTTSGYTNGSGASASFFAPVGMLAINPYYLLVCDSYNQRIRRIQTADYCTSVTILNTNTGTVNIGTINGTIPTGSLCFNYNQVNPNANWWSFTPTQNGILDLTTVTPQNATTVDTRIAIYNGTCAALTCYTGNDNVSTTDLRSNLNDIILQAGTTYYFVFDDKISDNAAVNFFYEFTPQTCFRPISVTAEAGSNTETTYQVDWTGPSIGDTTPDFYTVQVGPEGYTVDSSSAIQTYTNLTGLTATLTGLTPSTVYDLYIKSNCSPTDASVWFGPFKIMTEFTSVNPTYTENFDNTASLLFSGWSRSGGNNNTIWRTYTVGPNSFTYNGTNAIYSITNPVVSTPTNVYAYSRKLNLVSGQNYNVSYYTRQVLGSGVSTNGYLQVNYTPNTDYTNLATHTQINALTVITDQNYINQNHNFTVPSNGEYRIAFRNALQRSSSSSTTATAWLMLDNVVVSTALSVYQFEKFGLTSYPNPVLDHITIQNPDNISITNYSIVDMNGNILQTKEFENNSIINISSLSHGVYIMQLETEKGILIKKIIKE